MTLLFPLIVSFRYLCSMRELYISDDNGNGDGSGNGHGNENVISKYDFLFLQHFRYSSNLENVGGKE